MKSDGTLLTTGIKKKDTGKASFIYRNKNKE